jgi:HNH endonuclease
VKADRWDFQQWEDATVAPLRRDGDRCGWCRSPFRNDAARHHRMPRRIGGDRLSNLVLLHTACHRTVHAHPEQARARGFIVSIHGDTETTPMDHLARGWRLLADDGSATPCDPPEPRP